MTRSKSVLCILVGLALGTALARADEREERERGLRQFFEGRSVTVWVDMPATSKGIDLQAGRPPLIDAEKHAERLTGNGVSIKEGTRVPITRVALKDDLIEFHLGGGGFNWLWNTSTVSASYVGKSRREKDLEREIKDENDPKRKRDLQRDLDRERDRREREERRSRESAEATNEVRREEDRGRALTMGSRFNIRFEKRVPPQAATPEGIMEALSTWIDFTGLPGGESFMRARPRPEPPGREERSGDDDPSGLRAGMARSEVAHLLGPPEHEESRTEGGLHKSVAIFHDGGRRLELVFVNGVLVQFKELR
jgi:hypothetical protein